MALSFADGWLRGGAKIGFKVFLNITPAVTNWTTDGKQFSLIFEENPLADFVELPDDGRAQNELWYSNLLCGVLRGSLEMVSSSWFRMKEKVAGLLSLLSFFPLRDKVAAQLRAMGNNKLTCDMDNCRLGEE